MKVLAILWGCMAAIVSWLAPAGTLDPTETRLPVIAPAEVTVVPTRTGVSKFLEKNQGFTSMYEDDTCYNITPDFIAEHSEFTIFKYDTSAETFVLYDGEVYHIGTGWGGSGVESMALADIDQDSQYELYYTFSFGSGIQRTCIGYFDPNTKKEERFDYASYHYGMMLTANEDGELCVNTALHDLDHSKDWFVDYAVRATEQKIGSIDFEDGRITLKIDPEYDDVW